MKTKMRKGVTVRYIGENELAKGMIVRVIKKSYSHIVVPFPIRYLSGEVHYCICSMPIEDFEIVQ